MITVVTLEISVLESKIFLVTSLLIILSYDNQQYESELDHHERDFYESKQMQLQGSQKDSLRSMSSTRHLERCETSNSSIIQ